MAVYLKRAYEQASNDDGYRVLVDRLWPRGMDRQMLALDEWCKSIAPSDQIRKAFHHGDIDWAAFRKAYMAELKQQRETVRPLARLARRRRITLVYSAKDPEHNNAVVLRQYLGMLGA